jgi:hypothetical protein
MALPKVKKCVWRNKVKQLLHCASFYLELEPQ